jgi:hypothetical protein
VHFQCIFSGSDTGPSGSSETQFTLAVPAITVSHRRLTCALATWPSAAQGTVVFRLFRGVGMFPKVRSGSGISDPGVGVLSEGGRLGFPGDARYTWSEVQRTENGQDAIDSSVDFTILQVWRSVKPTRASIGDGRVLHVSGFGFSTSTGYVCAFSSLGNVSGYDAEHQTAAVVTNSTHLTCSPSTHVGEATYPRALISLFTSVGGTIVPISKDGPPSFFEFLPAFKSILPTTASASQNLLLSKNLLPSHFSPGQMHACIAPAQIHTDKHAPLSAAFVILNRPLAI